MANNVVPFGKYKGQPVEAMAADRGYVDWLLAQPWFKDKHQNIYTLIINNFAEPSETPEHNALQALFLDDVFVKKVLAVHHAGSIYEGVWNYRCDYKSLPVEFRVSFERQGADVYVCAAGVGFNIEVKPSVGDDYPAVLRQVGNIAGKGMPLLFLEHYNGVGATRAQFVELFNRSGVKVVFRDEAERQLPVDWSGIELLQQRVDAASREFGKRWTTLYSDGYDLLRRLDKELGEALEDQRELLRDAVKSGDDVQIGIHGNAMLRGWGAANRRMEDAEIEKAKAIFPGAAIRIREK